MNQHPSAQQPCNLSALSNDGLITRLRELIANDHSLEAILLMHMGEVDARRLYRERAHPSMFRFVTDELNLAEGVAYKRITVARAGRQYPALIDAVARGDVHLTGACLLAPHLTSENVETLLAMATHQSKRSIEKELAARFPKPDVAASVRRLPPPKAAPTSAPAAPPAVAAGAAFEPPMPAAPRTAETPRVSQAVVAPLSLERFKIQFTADGELCAKLREVQDLLGPKARRDDLAAVFSQALDVLLVKLKSKKHGTLAPGKVAKPATTSNEPAQANPKRSRYIPRSVRREVYERDRGQCAYVDKRGHRCSATSGIEYHHRHPHGLGGPPTVDNMELRCRCHNGLAAEEDYGLDFVMQFRGQSGSRKPPARDPACRAGTGSSSRSPTPNE